jgi:hypothetical protein
MKLSRRSLFALVAGGIAAPRVGKAVGWGTPSRPVLEKDIVALTERLLPPGPGVPYVIYQTTPGFDLEWLKNLYPGTIIPIAQGAECVVSCGRPPRLHAWTVVQGCTPDTKRYV